MYNVPLLFSPNTVLLLSIAPIVKVSLIISICTPNGFSGTPRLATWISPDFVFLMVSTDQAAPGLPSSLGEVKAAGTSLAPVNT